MKKKKLVKTKKVNVVKKAVNSKKIKSLGTSNRAKVFSKDELAHFKKLLLTKKESVLEEIKHLSEETLKRSLKEASGDISSYTFHMADVATDTYDREFSFGLASSEQELLYDINDAIKKIDEGEFGLCEDCKCQISKKRLLAVPYARLCIRCQENRDKR